MFDSDSLVPHAVCWAAAPGLIWTMVITNAITFLSYLTICITLLYLVRRTKRVIVRDWAYFVVGFAAFIVACGSTHLLEVITTWSPIFWVDAATNLVTAALSAYVAMMLIRRVKTIAFSVNDYAARLANAQTEKMALEESLLAAQKLEDWSRMSAVVSHEIKNPLQAIQNLQFLIRATEGVPQQVMDLAAMAEEEAKRVLSIADASLNFIRQTAAPETIDLREAVESSRFLLAPLLIKRGVELLIRSQGDCAVEAFGGEARQVILNVIRNACEASQNGQMVMVELTGQNEHVDVMVRDEGMGIAADLLPSLFKFGLTTKGQEGNGMGLWTVKHILRKHGGDVRVRSQV
ncbi:MAG TPA: HAMP domain-containing sensor histidine kinase, partial [Acidobacteriaceae bacterium]